jgi:hypothetical protein
VVDRACKTGTSGSLTRRYPAPVLMHSKVFMSIDTAVLVWIGQFGIDAGLT